MSSLRADQPEHPRQRCQSGLIETPLFSKLGLGEADTQKLALILLQQIPAKRFGEPEEVATAVAFSSLR